MIATDCTSFMKFFFLSDDTLYKIYKTLEKAPINKSLVVYVDDGSDFFAHQWRAKQIKELIEQRGLTISFVAKNTKQQQYYEQTQLPYVVQHTKQRIKRLYAGYNFLFNIKQFHRAHQKASQYTHYMIFIVEGVVLCVIIYIIWLLIVPSATITITPATESEDIVYNIRFSRFAQQGFQTGSAFSVPMISGSLVYQHTLALSVRNAQYLRQPARGVVVFTNTSTATYSLVKGTQLISSDGLIFRTAHRVSVPGKQQGVPGTAFAEVVADEIDAQGQSIGPRGNISTGTTLLVRNLKNSLLLKQLVANPTRPFVGGSHISTGTVSAQDIATISGALYRTIQEQQAGLIRRHVSVMDGVLLPIYDMPLRVRSVTIHTPPGSSQSLVSGTMMVEIPYYYARIADIDAMMRAYFQTKPSTHSTMIGIQYNTLTFYPPLAGSSSGELILPTKVSVVRGYDINKDVNRIISDMKQRIVGLHKDQAQSIVIGYPEIATASISLSPWWYTSLPTAQSRILFQVR